MPQLLHRQGADWLVTALDRDSYHLLAHEGGLQLVPTNVPAGAGAGARPAPLLVRVEDPGHGDTWTVVERTPSNLRVNGIPTATGLVQLAHRDELRLGDARAYFSTERLAEVAPFGGDEVRCPRCAGPIVHGQHSVVCPGCSVAHHQLPDRPCWTHAPRCALCDAPTDLDAGLRWSPEDL